jgi:hypothetical protein
MRRTEGRPVETTSRIDPSGSTESDASRRAERRDEVGEARSSRRIRQRLHRRDLEAFVLVARREGVEPPTF